MKKILTLMCALALAGCTQTHVKTPTWELNRTSIFQNVEIPGLTIATNGTATLTGYSNDGGIAALETIIKAAVAAGAASSGVPVAPAVE